MLLQARALPVADPRKSAGKLHLSGYQLAAISHSHLTRFTLPALPGPDLEAVPSHFLAGLLHPTTFPHLRFNQPFTHRSRSHFQQLATQTGASNY